MKYKFSDVAAFYIGAKVQFVDSLDKTKTYGEFDTATITGIFQCPSGAGLTAQLCVDDWEEPIEPLVDEIKPVLRRLTSMTEDERFACLSFFDGEPDTWVASAKRTAYLLSKHFDLFGLIYAGLAIDKTKRINQ